MKRLRGAACVLLAILILALPVMAAEYAADSSRKIYDFAELLTADQETALAGEAGDFIQKHDMDLVVLTISNSSVNTNNKLHDYSNDFYNAGGFGKAEGGLMILINMQTRDVYITAHGKAANSFSQGELNNIRESVTPYLSNGRYYQAFSHFMDKSSSTISNRIWIKAAGSAGIGLLITGIVMGIIAFIHFRGLKAVPGAQVYLQQGGFNITHQRDAFLHTRTSRTAIPKNTSSGSSGGGGGGMRGGSRGSGGKF